VDAVLDQMRRHVKDEEVDPSWIQMESRAVLPMLTFPTAVVSFVLAILKPDTSQNQLGVSQM
jgi:hypothetical protein